MERQHNQGNNDPHQWVMPATSNFRNITDCRVMYLHHPAVAM